MPLPTDEQLENRDPHWTITHQHSTLVRLWAKCRTPVGAAIDLTLEFMEECEPRLRFEAELPGRGLMPDTARQDLDHDHGLAWLANTGIPQPPPHLPFDQALCHEFRQHAAQALVAHPELRSVVVVFDYHGGLNDGSPQKGVWTSAQGAVHDPPAIFGGLQNMMEISQQVMRRADVVRQHLQDQV
ncbi:MAG: hypothetical protein ACOC93_06260, partial [Planctomycetota bacterium]